LESVTHTGGRRRRGERKRKPEEVFIEFKKNKNLSF
jgi:hypothetical protein